MVYSNTVQSSPVSIAVSIWLGYFLGLEEPLNPEEREAMILKHNQILLGINDNDENAMVKQVSKLHSWYLQSRGKHTVLTQIKDALLGGGLLIFIIKEFVIK